MKTQEELVRLRDVSSQKQSSLNALLSEKQSLNSSINQYRSLNQTSKQEYNQNLQRLQDIEREISQYDQSIADAKSNIKVLEDKLSKISKFEDFMGNMSSILSKYAAIERKTIDISTMMVKELPKNEILNSELSKEVCKKKCLEAFEQLLVKLDDVNAVDSEGRTLLMHSLSNGFFPAVDILLNNPNIDFNITDNNGCNALMYACAMPHIDYIERIIDATDNINLRNNQAGDTALHLLLKNAGMDSVFSDEINLIKQAAGDTSNDIYFTGTLVVTGNLSIHGNVGGLRPDGYSLNQYKSLLICRQLNAQGADFSVLNNGGLSPYFYLCRNQQRYLANCLEDEGILDLNLLDENSFQGAAGKLLLKDHAALQNFIDNHPNCLEGVDANGDTLLHFAVQMRDLSLVQLIMDSGANQNIKNITNGLTPLFLACAIKEKAIAKYLIEQSPNLSIVDNSGFDSFLWSSELGDGDLMQQLIENGCNINVQDKSGKTTLFWMVMYGNGNMVDWLLANGVDRNITNADGALPIHVAAESGNVDMLKLILNNNVNIITDNIYKITPLWIACQNGHLDAVKFLLENGADPNLSRLDNGVSPACIAIRNKHVNVVKHLLSNPDIDLFLQDNDGKRLIDYVVQYCPESLEDLSLDSFISYLSTFVKEDSASSNTSINSKQEWNDKLDSSGSSKTDMDYWYSDDDMESTGTELLSRIQNSDASTINLEKQYKGRLTIDIIDELFNNDYVEGNESNFQEGKPLYIAFNLGGKSDISSAKKEETIGGTHWVAMCVIKQNNCLKILYKDSYGNTRYADQMNAIKNAFCNQGEEAGLEVEFISHNSQDQEDGSACGPMTLRNLEIMAKHIESNGEQSLIDKYQSLEFSKQSNVWTIREGHASMSSLDSAEEVVHADVEKTEPVLQNPITSIFDDSQSLAALHATSENAMLGDQDIDLGI